MKTFFLIISAAWYFGGAVLAHAETVEECFDKSFNSVCQADFPGVINCLNKALEMEPENALLYNNRGLAYACNREYEKAIPDFTKAIELSSRLTSAYNNRGIAYTNIGEYEKAVSDFNKSIEMAPENISVYNNRAMAYFLKKDYNKSWQDVRTLEKAGHIVNARFLEQLKKASEK